MARYSLRSSDGQRIIRDTVLGEDITINGPLVELFDRDYSEHMAKWSDNENIVLAILLELYRPHDKPDVFHQPD